MIKIEENSLKDALLSLKGLKLSVNVSKTWEENKNDIFEPDIVKNFYKNECGKGLIEKHSKIFPYKLDKTIHGSLSFSFSLRGILSFLLNSSKYLLNYIYFPILIAINYSKLPIHKNKIRDFYYYFLGKPFNGNINKYIYQLDALLEYKGDDPRNFLEVGAGYGGFCELVSQNFDFKNYFIIDLPETLAVSSCYLSQFSSLNVFLIEDKDDLSKIPSTEKRVILIPANLYEELKLENFPIDFFINSNSFAEIGSHFVNGYLDFFTKWSSDQSYFLSFNQVGRKEIHDGEETTYSLDWASKILNGSVTKRSVRAESELGIIEF